MEAPSRQDRVRHMKLRYLYLLTAVLFLVAYYVMRTHPPWSALYTVGLLTGCFAFLLTGTSMQRAIAAGYTVERSLKRFRIPSGRSEQPPGDR